METVIECQLHEEDNMKSKDLATSIEEALIAKYRKRGPRCHFCNKLGHIQRNCYEKEKQISNNMPRKENT